jgi:hypothetical protein
VIPVNQQLTGTVSGFTKALLLVLGLTLVLVALGIVPIDPTRVHTSLSVLLATGIVFFMMGVLALVQPHQARHPNAYRLVLALLVSSGAGLVGLVTLYSHDERLTIGPFVFSGPAVDAFGKVVLGLDSLILVGAAVWCWQLWWRRRRQR